MTYTDIVSEALRCERGITFREFGNGQRRPMFHRFDYRKLRGSIPLRQHMAESIVRTNPLLRALMRGT
jgi:hypothetical protein